MKTSDNTLSSAIKGAIWHELENNLHTAIPAIVVEYDASGPSVVAKPIVQKLFYDGEVQSFSSIFSVPVIFPRTSEFRLTYPLKQGDGVLLIFSESALDNFIGASGKDGEIKDLPPEDVRRFDLTDAVAIPGLFPMGMDSKIENPDSMELVFKDTEIVSDGTDLVMTNGQATIETNGAQVKINDDGLTVD